MTRAIWKLRRDQRIPVAYQTAYGILDWESELVQLPGMINDSSWPIVCMIARRLSAKFISPWSFVKKTHEMNTFFLFFSERFVILYIVQKE